MSEFAEIRERRSRLLWAVYDAARRDRNGFAYAERFLGDVGLDLQNDADEEEYLRLVRELEEAGDVRSEVDEGTILSITDQGRRKIEGETDPESVVPQTVTFNVQNAQGSIIGTQQHAELTANFDFRSVEQRIEREGGEDAEELREALEEVRELLERGEKLDRGALSRFSGAMERHSWFTGAVAQALLGFATQAVG